MKQIEPEILLQNKKPIIKVIIIILFIIAILYFGKNDIWDISCIVPIGISLGVLFLTLKKAFNRNVQLIINSKGITDLSSDNLYDWTLVEFAGIDGQWLRVQLIDKVVNISLDNLEYSSNNIQRIIENYSILKIQTQAENIENDLSLIFSDHVDLQGLIKKMSKKSNQISIYSFILFLIMLGLSIYAQIRIQMPYTFAIGFSILLFSIFGFVKFQLKILRNDNDLSGLSKKDFDFLLIKFKIKNSDSKKARIGIILISIILGGIFVISYIISN